MPQRSKMLFVSGWRLASILLFAFASVSAAFAAPLTIPSPASIPAIKVTTLLTATHLAGLCFGFGGAVMLDFWIVRWILWGEMPRENVRMFEFISKVVTVGIIVLWLSGLGFLIDYHFEAPAKLANPKIYAKIAIVLALTLNGLVIHALVLPKVLREVDRPMLKGFSQWQAIIFLGSGTVSAVSWVTAFLLGVLRELNGVVSAEAILTVWLAANLVTGSTAYAFWSVTTGRNGFRLEQRAALRQKISRFVKPSDKHVASR